jgi:NADH-quinone oxidoreductase subunit J
VLAAGSSAASATETTAFWILAVLAVVAALGMIIARRAVHCAVLLAVVMLSLAVLYALQDAPFLAFVQVIVYTGAVLMLFLFVLMIVGVSSADSLVETIRGQRLAAGLVGIGLLVLLSLVIGHAALASDTAASASFGASNLNGLATLITAALGAMVLAHRERTSPKPTQRSLSKARMTSARPTPLPGPGTYARHNAVDMPALLPDGSPASLSVSPIIAARRAELSEGDTDLGQRDMRLAQGDTQFGPDDTGPDQGGTGPGEDGPTDAVPSSTGREDSRS